MRYACLWTPPIKRWHFAAASRLCLLGQSWEERTQYVHCYGAEPARREAVLCYAVVCCYGCYASQKRIDVSAAPMAPWISFQSLSLHLAYPGFSEQCGQCEQWDNWCHEQDQWHIPPLMHPNKCLVVGCRSQGTQCAQLCLTFCNPVACRPPGSSVHGVFQARIQSGLPFPPPECLPNPGIKPRSPVSPALQEDSLLLEPLGNPHRLQGSRS